MMPSSSSCAAHARFLRTLVEREELKARQISRDRMDNIDPQLQTPIKYSPFGNETHAGAGDSPPMDVSTNGSIEAPYSYQSYTQPEHALVSPQNGKAADSVPSEDAFHVNYPNQTHADHIYYDNMCRELGVTQGVDLIQGPPAFYHRMSSDVYPIMGQ